MQPDIDIIKKILIACKEATGPVTGIEGVPQNIFAFNVAFLDDDGFVDCRIAKDHDHGTNLPETAIIFRLTSSGFGFAQLATEQPTAWETAKEKVIKPAASWSLGLFLECLKKIIKDKIGL